VGVICTELRFVILLTTLYRANGTDLPNWGSRLLTEAYFPQYSSFGVWAIYFILLWDHAGNLRLGDWALVCVSLALNSPLVPWSLASISGCSGNHPKQS
jgi:hypothetical protein